MGRAETLGSNLVFSKNSEFYRVPHCTRIDGIVRIIPLKIGSSIRYEVVSRKGFVSRYDSTFKPLPKSAYMVPLCGVQDSSSSGHRPIQSYAAFTPSLSSKVSRPWITDVTFMEDVNVIIFAASDRSLHFRDVGGRGSPWMFRIVGMRNIPTCLAYLSSGYSSTPAVDELEKGSTNRRTGISQDSKTVGVLLFGDDMGNIWSLRFLQPQESLFYRSRRKGEGAEQIHWLDLERDMIPAGCSQLGKISPKYEPFVRDQENPHRKFVEMNVAWSVHVGGVSQVSFCGSTPQAMVSCSSADRLACESGESRRRPGASLVLKTPSSRASPYIFKIPSGISCFAFWEAKADVNGYENFLLATGSCDALIRLWNPYVPKGATACLTGHTNPIMDLEFLRKGDELLLISISSGAEIRIWKAAGGRCHENSCCIQAISLTFSNIAPLNKATRFGSKVLYVQENKKMGLLVTCCNEVAVLEFASDPGEEYSCGSRKEILMGSAEKDKSNLPRGSDGIGLCSTSDSMNCYGTQHESHECTEWEEVEVSHSATTQRLRIFSCAAEVTKPPKKYPGINERQSLQQKYEKEMRKFVSLCTPHLALPIYPPVFVASQPSVKSLNHNNRQNETAV